MAEKSTCTTKFLMPGIGLFRKSILRYGFEDAYIGDKTHEPHHVGSIYLLFKPHDMAEFQYFLEDEYLRTKSLVEDYDYPGGYVVLVYRFPEQFTKEYQLFMEGKYSEFSAAYKELFPTHTDIIEEGVSIKHPSLAFLIFSRHQSIKDFWERKLGVELPADAELWSKPEAEKETLNIEYLQLLDKL